jgi:hypothetical protein
LGLLLGFAFGVAGIYAAFFFERRPHVTVDVFSNSAILDVREELGGLEVLFNGVDIQETDQTLRILLVRLVNDGQMDILIDRYDTRDLPGFSVSPGQVVQPPEVVEATSDYLRDNLSLHLANSSTITIDPIILERGQHITIRVLLLIPEDALPQIQPVGKIAGVGTIPVSTSFTRTGTPPFLTRAFTGDIAVHGARLLAYTLLAIALLIAGLLIGSAISDLLSRRKRSRLVRTYLKSLSFQPVPPFRQLLDLYIKKGDAVLFLLADISHNPKVISKTTFDQHGERIVEGASIGYPDVVYFMPDFKDLARTLEREGMAEKRASGHFLNSDIARLLPAFLKYLRREGALDEHVRLRLRRRKATTRPLSRSPSPSPKR